MVYGVLRWLSSGYDDVSLADQLSTPNPCNIGVSKVWKNVWLGRGKHQQHTEHISFWFASGGTTRGRQTQPDSVGQVRRNRASRKLVSIINQWAGKHTKTRHACVSTITLNARGELGVFTCITRSVRALWYLGHTETIATRRPESIQSNITKDICDITE
jgi:hypothetical protein